MITRFDFRITPVRSRVLYDLGVTCAAAALAFAFARVFGREGGAVLALAPPFLLAANAASGIYTRLRVGAGSVKAVRLTAGLVASGAALVLLSSESLVPVLLWAALAWGPLVLPRVLLNLDTRVRTNFIATAIQSRGPVLVVGGAGYIGTHLVADLLAANQSVRVLDRMIYGKKALAEFMGNPRFELVEGDVTDIVKLLEAMNKASAVVHLAGLVGDPACAIDQAFTRHANIISTRMAKEAALSLGIPRFIFASSCSVYGTTDREVGETDELNPVSLYARTKIDSERELLLCPDDNFCVTILRFATVFGHSRRPRFDLVANLFTAQAINDGRLMVTGEDQWRPFVHVRDLARAIALALRADPGRVRGQIYNVGDHRYNMTIGQLAELVASIVGRERQVVIQRNRDVSDRRNYAVSFDKIRARLGFDATVSVADGIEEMVREFKKGTYGNWRDPTYSNLEMTKQALSDFRDPLQSARLYGPLTEVPGPASVPLTQTAAED